MIIDEAARAFGVDVYSAYYSDCIMRWRAIYENRPAWRSTKKGGLFSRGDRQLSRLNMAKVLCDELAALTFSEQCEIVLDNEIYQRYIDDALNSNGFRERFPEFLCSAYAMGGAVLKCRLEDSRPCIDYIIADRFIPTKWDGQGVREGIFISSTARGPDWYHLLEYCRAGSSQFKLYKNGDEKALGKEVALSELYPELPAEVKYETTAPMFAYFRPFVSNNADYDTPLGMSVFANSVDTLSSLDMVFDSFSREFILGKKRIIVPSGCIRMNVDPDTGDPVRYFDSDDEAFVALKTEDSDGLKITDNTVDLRVEQHVSSINALLNILCMQTGLSAGTFSFDAQQGMKTATEIISQESKTARTVKNNKNLLTETIETTVRALVELGIMSGKLSRVEYSVTVGWNDNIIIDDNTMIDNNIKLVSAGLKSKIKAIMEVQKCDEETARRELERINSESGIGGGALDFFGAGDAL